MPTKNKYTPHVHAEVIKAWADGKPIEYKSGVDRQWVLIDNPSFLVDFEYRVKPEEVVSYTVVHPLGTPGSHFHPSKEEADSFYNSSGYNQGYCKRVTIDGKVVSLEFIPK